MTHTYLISGMTCSSCVARVKSEILKLGDVTEAELQLAAPQARITMTRHIPVSVLQGAVQKAGHYSISANGEPQEEKEAATPDKKKARNSSFPILLILGFITLVTLAIQWSSGGFHWMSWMNQFMAGFFLMFSLFKLMDLPGFARGYLNYDIIAGKIPVWGYVYPFVELVLGLAFLTETAPVLTNILALGVMATGAIGVARSLMRKSSFQCACLGTAVQLPLSRLTLFEDLLMAGMSLVMLLSLLG